jgi:hypothetical protein
VTSPSWSRSRFADVAAACDRVGETWSRSCFADVAAARVIASA